MYDICDGTYVQNHSLFKQNPKALQIILNTDDVEIVNPLGSHIKKHKLSMFYFTIANIRPEFRSQLQTIQLLAIAKTRPLRKHSAVGKLLEDFISAVNRLSSGGVKLFIHGQFYNIEGALVCAPCDTLAANWLGQLKKVWHLLLEAADSVNVKGKIPDLHS